MGRPVTSTQPIWWTRMVRAGGDRRHQTIDPVPLPGSTASFSGGGPVLIGITRGRRAAVAGLAFLLCAWRSPGVVEAPILVIRFRRLE